MEEHSSSVAPHLFSLSHFTHMTHTHTLLLLHPLWLIKSISLLWLWLNVQLQPVSFIFCYSTHTRSHTHIYKQINNLIYSSTDIKLFCPLTEGHGWSHWQGVLGKNSEWKLDCVEDERTNPPALLYRTALKDKATAPSGVRNVKLFSLAASSQSWSDLLL